MRVERATVALGLIASLLLSSPLWLSSRLYPFTPVCAFCKPVPPPFDRVLFGAMLLLLLGIAVLPRAEYAIAGFMVVAGGLAMADQSRWQPWFYQYYFLLLAIGLRAPNVCRLTVASTYFWSGMQKLNSNYMDQTFPSMLGAMAVPLRPLLPFLGVATPMIEIAIGCCLLTRRTRRPAVLLAIAMHLAILAAIGPLGANVNRVVWPWNVAMTFLVAALFWNAGDSPGDILRPRRSLLHAIVLLLFAVAPLLSFFHLWDSYLSAALYSSNKDTAVIRLADSLADRLPEEVQEHITVGADGIDELDVNEWSFDALHVPAYPEARIFRSVTRWVCGFARGSEAVRLTVHPRQGLLPSRPDLTWSCEDLAKGSALEIPMGFGSQKLGVRSQE